MSLHRDLITSCLLYCWLPYESSSCIDPFKLLVAMASAVTSFDVKVRRRCVKRPILRCKLVSMIKSFSASLRNRISSNFYKFNHSSIVDFQPHILDHKDVSLFFGDDTEALNMFQSCSGIMLRTVFARQFALRYRILGDIAFWHFWEAIAMQSGWFVLDVKKFNDVFNSGVHSYLCLVRRMPTSVCTSCPRMTQQCSTFFCSLHRDRLSVCRIVYTALSEIVAISCKKFKRVGIFGDRPRCSTNALQFTDLQVRLFRYQVHSLRRMIAVRAPVADILLLLLDLNALVLCFCTPVPSDFDACNVSSVADPLESEIRYFVRSSVQVEEVKSVFDEMDKVVL